MTLEQHIACVVQNAQRLAWVESALSGAMT